MKARIESAAKRQPTQPLLGISVHGEPCIQRKGGTQWEILGSEKVRYSSSITPLKVGDQLVLTQE